MSDTFAVFGTDRVGWSIDRDAQGWVNFLSRQPGVLVTNIWRANTIICVWYEQILRWYPLFFLLCRILRKRNVSVVTNDIRSISHTSFVRLSRLTDVWVAPNRCLEEWLIAKGVRVVYMPFFVSSDVFFRSIESRATLAQKIGIDFKQIEQSFLVGSFQRDSLGKNLQLPKWQKDPNLLLMFCEALLQKMPIVLLIAGPRRHYVVHQCRKRKIPYIFIGNEQFINDGRDDMEVNIIPPYKMNLLYNIVDISVVSSASEAGPKNIYESILTQTPVISTRVGLATEVVHPSCFFSKEELNSVIHTVFRMAHAPHFVSEVTSYNLNQLTRLASMQSRRAAWQNICRHLTRI